MLLSQLLTLENTHCHVQTPNKKKLFDLISRLAAIHFNRDPQQLLSALLLRERIGNTAIGQGIAIPHAKLVDQCIYQQTIIAYFLQLEKGIEFYSNDPQPVDLVFVLFFSEQTGVRYPDLLLNITHYLSNKQRCQRLRTAKTDDELYQRLLEKAPML